MHRSSRTAALLILSLLLVATPVLAEGPIEEVEDDLTEPTVMVKLDDGSWEPRSLSGPIEEQLEAAVHEPGVIDAAPIRTYRVFAPSNPPNDPDYPQQWHLRRTEAARAWRHGDGAGVVVAVIDSGVANHADLACHQYVSPYDFVTNRAGVPPDPHGHGTFVTAVLAECTDNGINGAGTAPGVGIMPLRVIDGTGGTTTFELQRALEWARNHGAKVVNLSLGFPCAGPHSQCRDRVIDEEISALAAAGAVVVAAAGNDGGTTGFLAYPANHPQVVAVGASNPNGTRAAYSDVGPGLDLLAPVGNGISHLGVPNSAGMSGTSFAAPQVSGAVALLLSAGAPSGGQAVTALRSSARDIPPAGYDIASGYGELQIREALAWGGLGLTPPIADASFFAAGDFTGDNKDDTLVYDGRFGRWWVLPSTGSAFGARQWARFSTVTGWATHLVGDFNGDGRDDIASYHPSNGTWWISRSTGTRFVTTRWATFSTRTGWASHLVGDFNGDGRDDIASYFPGNGTWWISRSTGSGFVTTRWATFSTRTGWAIHLVGDFNGDGRDDIASYHPSNGTWWVSRSTGSSFASPRLWATFSTRTGWRHRVVGDFNGDGRDDIAQFYPGNGTWWISRSTGSAFTTTRWATLSSWSSRAGLLGDYNGDGRYDLADPGSRGSWWVGRSTGSSFSGGLWYP